MKKIRRLSNFSKTIQLIETWVWISTQVYFPPNPVLLLLHYSAFYCSLLYPSLYLSGWKVIVDRAQGQILAVLLSSIAYLASLSTNFIIWKMEIMELLRIYEKVTNIVSGINYIISTCKDKKVLRTARWLEFFSDTL